MAEILDGDGYWLPSEFLTDEELLTDFKQERKGRDEISNRFGSSFGRNAVMNSPAESVTGLAETAKGSSDYRIKELNHSVLPQSSSLYRLKPVEFQSGVKYLSPVTSSPSVEDLAAELEFFYAGTADITRLKMNEVMAAYHHSNIHQNRKLPASVAYPPLMADKTKSGILGQVRNGSHFHDLGRYGLRQRSPGSSATPWLALYLPPQQQQSPSQIHPSSRRSMVFLPENGATKERTGTGVFLPRKHELNPPDSRKKPTDRMVHSIDVPFHARNRDDPICRPEYDVSVKKKTNIMMKAPPAINNQELWLPPEWTY